MKYYSFHFFLCIFICRHIQIADKSAHLRSSKGLWAEWQFMLSFLFPNDLVWGVLGNNKA